MLVNTEEVTVFRPLDAKGGLQKSTEKWIMPHLPGIRKEAAPVLKNISCEFPCGSSVILGPNGSGKTTLLQVLAGLILPKSGRITIDGIVADPLVLRQVIGYLPQAFGLYPNLTAREMLHYVALLKGLVDRRIRERSVEEVLQRTGLLAVAERKVGKYSRGMRQKVGIAQTLLGNPQVLIFDEPTAGLDPEERNKLRGMVMELGLERVVIWASSLITDTSGADRVLVIDCGESRFWGTPSELAACACSKSGLRPADRKTNGEHWSDMLERGYRATLLSRASR